MHPFRMMYSVFCAESSTDGPLERRNKEAHLESSVAAGYRKDFCWVSVVKSAASI